MPQDIIKLRSSVWLFFSLYLLPHCISPCKCSPCLPLLLSWLSVCLCFVPVYHMVCLSALLQLRSVTLPVVLISSLLSIAVRCILSYLNHVILFLVWRRNVCHFFSWYCLVIMLFNMHFSPFHVDLCSGSLYLSHSESHS